MSKLCREAPNRRTWPAMKLLASLAAVTLAGAAVVTVVIPAVAADSDVSVVVPEFRFPADTTSPGLRLISMLHDIKGKTFAQGRRRADQGDNESYFARPRYVALGGNGEIYTLDGARGVIYETTYRAGELVRSLRIPKNNRSFLSPIALAVAPDGSLWLTDSRSRAVFVIDSQGKTLDSLTGLFVRPVGIAFQAGSRHMLVTDLAKNTIVELSLTQEVVKTHGASDSVIVEGPSFITVGPAGKVYVVDALGGTVSVFSSDWKLSRRLGGFGDGPGYFSKPKGVAVDRAGRVYVADALFDNIQIFDKDDRLLLTLGSAGSAPGQFLQPMGIAIDESGDIYVADSYNGRVQVFRWESLDQ